LTNVLLAGFGTDRLRRKQAMKTATKENHISFATPDSDRAPGAEGSEQILLHQVGCESRKIPAAGEVFFLTSPFIEQTRS
jgi:hypothetical protein